MTVNITGTTASSKYGLHIHTYGDMTNGCTTLGAHYNPKNKTHGDAHGDTRHEGDLGNVQSDSSGNIKAKITNVDAQIIGKNGILGRGCVIHAGEDKLDGGVNMGGSRMACGVIGWEYQE